jgi:phage shock protein E
MNIYKNSVTRSHAPSITPLQKTLRIAQFVVGLEKMQLLPKHQTSQPASLIVLEGTIVFKTLKSEVHLERGDFYVIPMNTDHEVLGADDHNIFIVTKEV